MTTTDKAYWLDIPAPLGGDPYRILVTRDEATKRYGYCTLRPSGTVFFQGEGFRSILAARRHATAELGRFWSNKR